MHAGYEFINKEYCIEDCINLFNNQKSVHSEVKLIKKIIKNYYGFNNKFFNDSRMLPKDDLLKESISFKKDSYLKNYQIAKDYFNYIQYTKANNIYKASSDHQNRLSNLLIKDLEVYQNDKDNLLLTRTFKLKNFISLQAHKDKKSLCSMKNHINFTDTENLINFINNEKSNFLSGNCFSNSFYFDCMNLNFDGYINNKQNLKHPLIQFNIINNLKDFLLSNKDKLLNTDFIFMDFLFDVLAFNLEKNKIDVSLKDSKYNLHHVCCAQNDIEGMAQIEILLRILPYMLSPLYDNFSGNIAATIFFMSLTIYAFKIFVNNIQQDSKEEKYYLKLCRNLKLLLENLKLESNKKINVSNIFNIFKPICTLLHKDNRLKEILKCFVTNENILHTEIYPYSVIFGKEDISNKILFSSIVEIFSKIEKIRWFDFSIFEININDTNANILEEYAPCLLEAVLIYKNCLFNGNNNITIINNEDTHKTYCNNKNYTCLKRSDYSSLITKDFNFKYIENNIDYDCDFAAINIMTSLANSILINVENFKYKNEMLKTIDQLGYRNTTMLKVWNVYIFQHLKQMGILDINYRADELHINNETQQLQYMACVDYIFQIKCWIYDSYYFWRSYKKICNALGRNLNINTFLQVYNKFSTTIKTSFDNIFDNRKIIAFYNDNLQIDNVSGIYAYLNIFQCLMYYDSNIYKDILPALSNIILKEMYLLEINEVDFSSLDKTRYMVDDFYEQILSLKSPILQNIINKLNIGLFETILNDLYLKWYEYIIAPYLNYDTDVKNYVISNIGELPNNLIETIKNFGINDNELEVFGYTPITEFIINKSPETINLILHICKCVKYLWKYDYIIQRSKEMNYYRAFKYKDSNENIIGKYLNIILKSEHLFNSLKEVNLIETLFNQHIGTSIDDVFRFSNGLPIYLFYANGIQIYLKNLFLNEDENYPLYFRDCKNILIIKLIKELFVDNVLMLDNINEENTSIENAIIFCNNMYKINLEKQEYLDIIELINSYDIGYDIIIKICNIINMNNYLNAILISTNNNWDVDQYQKLIKQNIPDLEFYISIRNKLKEMFEIVDNNEVVIENNNIQQEEKIEIKPKNNIIKEDDCIIIDNIKYKKEFDGKYNRNHFNKNLMNNRINKLQSLQLETEGSKKLRDVYIQKLKFLNSKGVNFIYELL